MAQVLKEVSRRVFDVTLDESSLGRSTGRADDATDDCLPFGQGLDESRAPRGRN